MVVETTGAWAPEAMKVFRQVAAAAATTTGQPADQLLQELLQGCAVCVRRANARAALRRKAEDPGVRASAHAAAASELQAHAAAY
eukprot:12423047-Karenia_brevis.AAC.1